MCLKMIYKVSIRFFPIHHGSGELFILNLKDQTNFGDTPIFHCMGERVGCHIHDLCTLRLFLFFGPSVTGKTFRIGSVGLVYYVYTYI